MATATLRFDFTGIAPRIRWSNGIIVTSGSAQGQSYVVSSNVTITGTQPGYGRVDRISVMADGAPVSPSGDNGPSYSATVIVSCGTFSVSETFTGMYGHGTLIWPAVTSGTADMLSPSFWNSLKIETNDSFSFWADQASSVTVTIDYTENPPVLTAPTLKINGRTGSVQGRTCEQSWSGGDVSGEGTSPTDYMRVDIYSGSGTYIGYVSCQINAESSYSISSPESYVSSTAFYLICTYSGVTATSNTVYYQYVDVTITAPTGLLVNGSSSSTAQTCTLSWTASVCSDATATIKYQISDGFTVLASDFTSTQYTFPKSVCSQWAGTKTLQVCGYVETYGITSAMSNSVTFTFRNSYTVKWYAEGDWQECIIYYYNNNDWQECVPYIYDNEWKPCSAS